jgi:hypothetical protein
MAVITLTLPDFEGKDETDGKKPLSWRRNRRMLPPLRFSGETTKAVHFERRRAMQILLKHLIIPMVFNLLQTAGACKKK